VSANVREILAADAVVEGEIAVEWDETGNLIAPRALSLQA